MFLTIQAREDSKRWPWGSIESWLHSDFMENKHRESVRTFYYCLMSFSLLFLEFERSHFVLKTKVIYFSFLCKGLGNISLLNL